MATQNDLVQRFIENEKRSKQTTSLFVLIFILAAIGILYLAYNINEKEKELLRKKQEITQLNSNALEYQRIIDSLSKIITRPFEIKDSVNSKRNEELVKEVQKREVLIEKVKEDIANNTMNQNRQSLQREIQRITANSETLFQPQKGYTVFIQYNSNDNRESRQINRIRDDLEGMGYNVPKEEFRKGTFRRTYVCYFHDEDSLFASEVHVTMRRTYGQAALIRKSYKSPKKQIEIWVNSR
jgi:predicted Holliday junction resolvase-like endonuclease